MKIPLGGGAYLEPDEGPRNTPYHRRIVEFQEIPNTRTGNLCTLECGHVVQAFGRLELARGVVLCTACRDRNKP